MLLSYKTSLTHNIIMKKISLIVAMASIVFAIQSAHAQSTDTAKNKVEIKKKVKVGTHGRQVTKIKMESKGTPDAVAGSVDGAMGVNKTRVVAAPAASPTVVVVHDPAPTPAPVATTVTTTTEAKRVPVTTTHTTSTATSTHVVHATVAKPVYHKTTYKKKPVATSSSTTTTTTVKN